MKFGLLKSLIDVRLFYFHKCDILNVPDLALLTGAQNEKFRPPLSTAGVKKFYFIALAILVSASVSAYESTPTNVDTLQPQTQKTDTLRRNFIVLDSLKQTLQVDSVNRTASKEKKKFRYYFANNPSKNNPRSVKFDLQLDIRKTFIRDFPVDLLGLNIGLVLRRRFRWGGGFYFIEKNFSNQLLPLLPSTGRPLVDRQGRPIPFNKLGDKKIVYDTAQQKLEVYFGTFNFSYTFYASRLLEFNIPLEVGYGNFTEKLIDPSGKGFESLTKAPKPTSGHFFCGQVGIASVIKLHRWIYFFSSIGYRKTFHQTYTSENKYTSFNSQFDGYYYRLAIQLQIGTFLKDVCKKRTQKIAS